MQKKLLAVAVAGALVAPAAFAQTAVTISGVLNLAYESVQASGATNGTLAAAGSPGSDIKTRDRIQEGNGANIRFTVVEDLGSGMQAFGQVESAVFNNAGTQPTMLGVAAADGNANGRGFGSRNTGIGLRSNAWGEVLLGIWDIHYHEHTIADAASTKGMGQADARALFNMFGLSGSSAAGATNFQPTIGGRVSNVIRYASPTWGGFNFRVAYARPTDAAPSNNPGGAGDNGKDRLWSFTPTYAAGPLALGYSYLNDKDMASTTTVGLWPTTASGAGGSATMTAGLMKMTSNRFFGSYTLPMGFRLGFMWDSSKLDTYGHAAGGIASSVKRTAWAIPLGYTTGAHALYFTYGKAKAQQGNVVQGGAAVDISNVVVTPTNGTATTVGNATGAQFYQLSYQYDLSKRTNLHLTWAQIRNDAYAGYDFFSNGVGMTGAATATQGASFGADPRSIGIGLRHAF